MVCLMIKTTEKQDEKRREGEKQISSRGGSRPPNEERVKQKEKD